MPPLEINYLTIFVAALATFALGALWYSPLLFGKLWMKVHGHSADKIAEMQQSTGKIYGVSFVCYVVMAAVLAILVSYTGVATASGGLWLGFLCWLGFAATIGLTANLFSEKPLAAYLIDAGYQLAYLLFMGALLALWR